MIDTAKSRTLNEAKDRLEASLARINELVTEKNAALMEAQATTDEAAHLKERVAQLEALNAEHDVAVTHKALHGDKDELDKKAIIKLRDEYEKLKASQKTLEGELFDAKKQLAASSIIQKKPNAKASSDETLKLENASLQEELSNKIRQVNGLENAATAKEELRDKACNQIDSLIGRVELMMEQNHV